MEFTYNVSIWLTIILVGIILMISIFVIGYLENRNYKTKINLCNSLNGTIFIYAFDQPEFLCKINEQVLNFDTGKIINPRELVD